MIKGSYTAIIVSVLLHIMLLLALIYSSTKTELKVNAEKAKSQPIRSFLYKAPKKTAAQPSAKKTIQPSAEINEVAIPQQVSKKQTVKTAKINKTLISTQKDSTTSAEEPINSSIKSSIKSSIENNHANTNNQLPVSSKNNSQQKPLTNFSSYDRLSRLRKNIESQQRQQAFGELTQKRSASSMDGEQFPVPKTIVPLTAEQQYILNTSTSHVGSITKNNNGTCTIYREQVLGSPVEATTSYFACGESDFDKSFREHMQKVQAKLSATKKP